MFDLTPEELEFGKREAAGFLILLRQADESAWLEFAEICRLFLRGVPEAKTTMKFIVLAAADMEPLPKPKPKPKSKSRKSSP